MKNLLSFSDLHLNPDFFCFSHLRWDFVFQRPQHLMNRFAENSRVFFMEEYVIDDTTDPFMELRTPAPNLCVATPHVKPGMTADEIDSCLKLFLDQLMQKYIVRDYVSWYYTPMALSWSSHLQPSVMVYDCMDELSLFKFAPVELTQREKTLMSLADIVFTGGESLYRLKRSQHPRVYAFPSSIDQEHFAKARQPLPEPLDQQHIPYPRLGFFGVLDERLDIPLLTEMAALRPSWHFVLTGPVVKIEKESLPQAPNIHYTGMKTYNELPAYISNWNVALILFALNDSTRFISPTKTPEYLAAGKPVVSTPIHDIIATYGEKGLVHIAGDTAGFIAAVEAALLQDRDKNWLKPVDEYLSGISWNQTWADMVHLICQILIEKSPENKPVNLSSYV